MPQSISTSEQLIHHMRVWSTECTNAQSTEWESDAYTLQATMAGLNGDSKEREINTQTYLEKVKKSYLD